MKDNAFYLEEIKKRLSEKRFNHSLCVADAARHLAKKYGCDENKAYTAGLIHDILKDTPKQELKAYIIKYNGSEDSVLLAQPPLWHAAAGALFLKNELFVDDEEIYLAVRYHTSGRANMSLLEKVVFTADFISADRDYPGVDIMREKAEISLDTAMEEGLNFTITELCSKKCPIYIDTCNAYNDAVMHRILNETEE